jgi:hypothetical protein
VEDGSQQFLAVFSEEIFVLMQIMIEILAPILMKNLQHRSKLQQSNLNQEIWKTNGLSGQCSNSSPFNEIQVRQIS